MTDRPTFPDHEHPLYTPDAEAQAQVTARIKQAMETGKRHKSAAKTKQSDGTVLDLGAGGSRRMGVREYKVTQEQVAEEWGVSVPTTRDRLRAPAKINYWDAQLLADELGVTIDWLRFGGVNGYDLFEDADVVALLYDELSAEDKEHLCWLLKRLAGPEGADRVRQARLHARHIRWMENHPQVAKGFQEQLSAVLIAPLSKISEKIQATFAEKMQVSVAENLQAAFENSAFMREINRLRDQLEPVARAADILKSHGMTTAEIDELSVGEIIELAQAYSDYVEEQNSSEGTTPKE